MNPRVVTALQVLGVVFCVSALAGSFAMSFQTWVAIGTLAGFGALAVAMPLCVDGHVMTALTTWLSPVSPQLARFARANLYAVGAASVIAQSTYHAVITWQGHPHAAPHNAALTALALGSGAFPPIVATLAVHLAVGIVREAFTVADATPELSASQPPSAQPSLQPLLVPSIPKPLEPHPSPEVVSRPATSQPPDLSAVPSLAAAPKPPATNNRQVTADDVKPLLGLARADIARQLGTSVATVDRRLRELRDRQAVPA